MLAYLEGRLLERETNACVLVTEGGTGYELFLPTHALAELPEKGGVIQFYVSQIIREDAQELFGFATWDERQTFNLLIGINRVGPRTALAILSCFRPDDLRRLVLDEDVNALTRVPGIGKKTGQQIFLELKYKLKLDGISGQIPALSAGASVFRDALTGLTNLGYDEDSVAKILKEIMDKEPDLDVSAALRAALKALSKG